MSSTWRFRDHQGFHRASWQMAVAGAAAGGGAALIPGVGPAPALALLGAAAVFGAMDPEQRKRAVPVVARAVAMVLAAGVFAALLRAEQPRWAELGFAFVFAGVLAWGLRGLRLLVAVAAGAGIALLALRASGSISMSPTLTSWPAPVLGAAAGAAFAFVSAVALLARHVDRDADPVGEAHARVLPVARGEVRELVERAHRLWGKAVDSLGEGDDDTLPTLRDGVLRLYAVAARWSAVEADGAAEQRASLTGRIAELDGRIADTEDEVARAQYAQARGGLAEQLRYLDDIGKNRERVLARLHNYLAAMERLRLAVINLRSTDASRDADAVQPLLANLQDLGEDIDASATALADAELA